MCTHIQRHTRTHKQVRHAQSRDTHILQQELSLTHQHTHKDIHPYTYTRTHTHTHTHTHTQANTKRQTHTHIQHSHISVGTYITIFMSKSIVPYAPADSSTLLLGCSMSFPYTNSVFLRSKLGREAATQTPTGGTAACLRSSQDVQRSTQLRLPQSSHSVSLHLV